MKIDRIQSRARRPLVVSVAGICAATLLTGCMGSPTYGTGKSSNLQLMEDVTGMLTLGAKERPEIAYTPRGEIVRPGSMEVLPEPQQELASTENPAWPESPEQRRARIRQEATELGTAHPDLVAARPGETRQEFQRRRRESTQGEATNRRYLSEPPLVYRQPEATAPAGELGEEEWKKERAAQRAAGKKTSWRDWIPGL